MLVHCPSGPWSTCEFRVDSFSFQYLEKTPFKQEQTPFGIWVNLLALFDPQSWYCFYSNHSVFLISSQCRDQVSVQQWKKTSQSTKEWKETISYGDHTETKAGCVLWNSASLKMLCIKFHLVTLPFHSQLQVHQHVKRKESLSPRLRGSLK